MPRSLSFAGAVEHGKAGSNVGPRLPYVSCQQSFRVGTGLLLAEAELILQASLRPDVIQCTESTELENVSLRLWSVSLRLWSVCQEETIPRFMSGGLARTSESAAFANIGAPMGDENQHITLYVHSWERITSMY